MEQPASRLRWLVLASALVACGTLLALLSGAGALGFLLTLGVCDDVKGPLWLWYFSLAYPAFVFGKWARAAWRAGAGTALERDIAFAIVTTIVTIVVTLFEWAEWRRSDCSSDASLDIVPCLVGFAFLAAYFFFGKAALRAERTARANPIGG